MVSCGPVVSAVFEARTISAQNGLTASKLLQNPKYTSWIGNTRKLSRFANKYSVSNYPGNQRKCWNSSSERIFDLGIVASNDANAKSGGLQSVQVSPSTTLTGSGIDIHDRVPPKRTLSNQAVSVSKEQLPIMARELEARSADEETLHIKSFLKGKHILITGATGGLGKVLVEKILRVQPDVGQLYLFIQERPDVTVDNRLEKNIIDSEVFRLLRSRYGQSYKEFMHQKLTAVGGSLTSPGLGMTGPAVKAMASKIDIIVNSAATTTLNERYDVALDINTLGPQRILEFAKQCPKIPLFLQVSTGISRHNLLLDSMAVADMNLWPAGTYVNGKREGPIAEKPFKLGDNLAQEIWLQTEHDPTTERKHFPAVDPHFEVQLAGTTLREAEWRSLEKGHPSGKERMVELGRKRAQLFGWHDSYTFAKAMGEMLLEANKGEIPIAIVRPSIIESTVREPFAGWIEGVRMMDPVLVSYGKGQLEGFFITPETILDLIPADVVVNVIIAAMAKHYGYAQRSPHVYQVASSNINPMTLSVMAEAAHDHFKESPLLDNHGKDIRVGRMGFHSIELGHAFYLWLRFKLPSLMSKIPWIKKKKSSDKRAMMLQKTYETFSHIAQLYKPYAFFKGRFDSSNSWALLGQITYEEQETFNSVDVKTIDWHNYLYATHIPGLRKYVLKGRGTKAPNSSWTTH